MSTDTAMDRLRAANPAPDTRLLRDESDDLAVLLATTWQRSTRMQSTQPQGVKPPQEQRRRGWVVAAATFALVIVVALTAALMSSRSTDGETVAPTTTAAPTTTVAPTTTQATPTTTVAPTTTQATPTTTLPFIEAGTYAVPGEVPAGTYRHRLSVVRLDENMEIIDNYLVADPDGVGIVIVQPTDSFISVEAWIITVEDFGRPIDPIAEGLSNGVYLVGYDIAPGRYQVLPGDAPRHRWARLDDQLEIIDSGTGSGTLEVVVEASDFAFEYSGILRLIP